VKLTDTRNPLNRWYGRLASGKAVVVFCVAFLISQGIIVSILLQLGHSDPLILQLTFSRTVFMDILQKWGQTGIGIYKKHFFVDYPHAFIYTGFLASLIAYLTEEQNKEPARGHLLLFSLPYVAGLCDLAENTLHLILIRNPVAVPGTLVKISATVTWTKWGLAGISIMAIVFLVLKKTVSRKERRSS
jgi:hypothetical protein